MVSATTVGAEGMLASRDVAAAFGEGMGEGTGKFGSKGLTTVGDASGSND
jgi:hypothetical protein